MINNRRLQFWLSVIIVIPIIANQFSGLISSLPEYITTLQKDYGKDIAKWMNGLPMLQTENIQSSVADYSGVAIRFVEQCVASIFHSGMAVVNALSLLLITPVVAFYLLRDWDAAVARLDNYLPRAQADTIRTQLSIIDATLAGFIRGQLNVCLILGIYYAMCLSMLGLQFGILIGFMTGMLVIIPYVGALFGAAVGLTVAFFQFPTYDAVMVMLVVFLIGQVIEGYLLTPRLVGKRVGLHPVWIIFGMLAGAALFGFVGVLIAVPASAVIGVLIRFALERYLVSSYYRGETALK
ncbi:MAG: AI-2E family transporter [Alphaproteobacteria bacterium]|nr:AI-2E family transporter [Alphaproteobacteria bacterium]